MKTLQQEYAPPKDNHFYPIHEDKALFTKTSHPCVKCFPLKSSLWSQEEILSSGNVGFSKSAPCCGKPCLKTEMCFLFGPTTLLLCSLLLGKARMVLQGLWVALLPWKQAFRLSLLGWLLLRRRLFGAHHWRCPTDCGETWQYRYFTFLWFACNWCDKQAHGQYY